MADLDREGRGIAVLATFVPSIFHPVWFADQELLRADEADRAEIKIVSPEFTLWSISWLQVQVTTERLDLVCNDAITFEALRDLAAGAMKAVRGCPTARVPPCRI